MAKNNNLTDFLTGVANAIRAKKGTTAKINPQNFEAEISSITTSKPEQEKTVEATNSRQIIFPDYGKTLSKVIVEAAPLPSINSPVYKIITKCLINIINKILILGCDDSVIPSDDSVTSISDGAFYYCSSLTSVTIPNSVTSIGDYAFDGCSGLKSVTIPDSVTSIGRAAFYGCFRIESLVVTTGNTKYHSANNCIIETESKTLILGCKNSVIPSDDSVTSIGDYAFGGCLGLTSITIPNSVTSIGGYAFAGCSDLTSITMLPTNPPTLGSSAIPSNVTTITVPVGCGDEYKTAAGWSAYADKIVEATA